MDSGMITAPLPGTIIDIKVVVGEKVNEGQVILTLESMKMENGIHTNKSGMVTDIKVSKGQNVNYGELLVVIG